MIRLQTLGSLDLRAADGAVLHPVLRQSKRSALLAYLAIERPGQFHRRDQLLGLFWPESDLKGARGSLSQAIHFLRQNLGKDAIINRGDEEIALNQDLVWCDAAAFQAHVAAGEYEQAVELYAGDVLPGVFVGEAEGFEQWLEQKRDTLKRQATDACVALADQAEREGRFDDVARWLRRAIKLFPYDENLHRRLIIALDGAGDRAAALRAYDELVQTLRTEFDAEPSAETTELIIQVRSRTEAQIIPLPARPVYAIGNGSEVERRAVPPVRRKRNLLTAVAIGVLAVAGMLWSAWSDREPAQPEAPINRIAVLFFNDVSPQRNLSYLAEGLTTSLIDHLGQVNQIEVISQNGVRPFRGDSIALDSIARQLDVGTIVGGNISESNGILRVNVQLVKGATGIVAQSRTFERPTGELFALLDDVASEVGTFLRSSVGNEIRMQRYRAETHSVEAWGAVQRAEELLAVAKNVGDRGDPRSSATLFNRADSLLTEAAELDRRWAEPLVVRTRLAENEAWLSFYGGGRGSASEHLQKALHAANQALERNASNAAAYEARGRVRYVQWLLAPPRSGAEMLLHQAESDLVQAITIDANRARAHSTLSLVYESQGRFAEARRSAQSALDADAYLEDAFQIVVRLFNTSFELKDDEEAGRWCDEMRRRLPANWPSAHCDLLLLGWRDDVKADARKALYILETFGAADSPEMRKSMLPRLTILAAATVARAGDTDEAETMVANARAAARGDVESLYLEAAFRVRVGQLDRGRALLNEYVQKNPNARVRVENGRFFEPLRAVQAAARN